MGTVLRTHLLFARHGETDDNSRLVFQGQRGHGLNRRGRAQAARLAERLARNPPDTIVASDLERAASTAKAVAEACRLPMVLDPDLREVDVGAWTGKSHREVQELFPDEWAAWTSGVDIRRGGGETYGELADRIERVVARVATQHAGRRVLLVSHGGAIKSWIASLLDVSAKGMRALGALGNASLTFVTRDDRGASRLHGWNDTAHLEGLVVEEGAD